MNNKGFAITTILYGILMMATIIMFLLISTMSFTKKSSTDFINNIETDLNKCVNPDDPACITSLQ